MSDIVTRLKAFVEYAQPLKDEKGEAQVFCDRLFRAFGHQGYKEAGATLEARVPKKGAKGKKFIDLIWKPRVLIEMKSAGENLNLHYQQAFEYWIAAVSATESAGESVRSAGIPDYIKDRKGLVSKDCIKA